MSTPSMRHSNPFGVLPRMEMALLPSSVPTTPAKAVAMRAGSFTAAAYRRVSSTEKERVLTTDISLMVSFFSEAFTTTSFNF
jgi:hypothetical protein